MARPPKYKSDEERLEAKRAQNRRSAQIKRRRVVGLDPEAPLYSTHASARATRGKLNNAQVAEARRLREREGWTITTLARQFNVSERAMLAALKGESHKS